MQKKKLRSFPAAFIAMMFVLAAMIVAGSSELRAQCNTLRIVNNAKCNATICVGPSTTPTCYTVPAGGSITITAPLPGQVIGILNTCGVLVPLANTCPGPIPIGTNCCINACLSTASCTVVITQVANACNC